MLASGKKFSLRIHCTHEHGYTYAANPVDDRAVHYSRRNGHACDFYDCIIYLVDPLRFHRDGSEVTL